MELSIRNCTSSDFEGIYPLLLQLWPGHQMDIAALKVVYERGLISNHQFYICVVDGERIAGFCTLTLKNNLWTQTYLGHIDELVVDEAYREAGLGRKLLARITELALENGCKRIQLDSSFHRTKAHDFYTNLGFERKGYLFSKPI